MNDNSLPKDKKKFEVACIEKIHFSDGEYVEICILWKDSFLKGEDVEICLL